jgi:hypothetical protein
MTQAGETLSDPWKFHRITLCFESEPSAGLVNDLVAVVQDEPVRAALSPLGRVGLLGRLVYADRVVLLLAGDRRDVAALEALDLQDPLLTRLRWTLEAHGIQGGKLIKEERACLELAAACERYDWGFEGDPTLVAAVSVQPALDSLLHAEFLELLARVSRESTDAGHPGTPASTGSLSVGARVRAGDLRFRLAAWAQAWWLPDGSRFTLR